MTISVLKNHPYVFERTRVSYQVTNVGLKSKIDHFTVVCLVTWPLNGSEAGVDLVLIQTSLLLLCQSVVLMITRCIYMTKAERSVSKQGQLQPHCHSKARSPSRQL